MSNPISLSNKLNAFTEYSSHCSAVGSAILAAVLAVFLVDSVPWPISALLVCSETKKNENYCYTRLPESEYRYK